MCVIAGFLEKNALKKSQKSGFLWNYWKIWLVIFLICFILKVYIFSNFCEKSVYWVIGQNASSQSCSRIFKLDMSPEQIDEITWFFCILIQIHENQKLIGKFLGGHDRKGLCLLGSRDSKICCHETELIESTEILHVDKNCVNRKVNGNVFWVGLLENRRGF